MMQPLGLGSVALLLPVAVWGYRLLGDRRLAIERLRVLVWSWGRCSARPSCPVATHCALAAAVRPRRSCRRRHARLPVLFHRSWSNDTAHLSLGLAPALVAFGTAAGMIFGGEAEDYDDYDDEDEKDDDEDREAGDSAWISLGFIEHHLLSFRAWLGRLFMRASGCRWRRAIIRDPAPPRRAALRRLRRSAADDAEDRRRRG